MISLSIRLREREMSDLTSGLVGALLGAFVAAVATYLVAKIQLKQLAHQHTQTIDLVNAQHVESLALVAKIHEEAMSEQNKLLKATFDHQILLQANEQRIKYQLDFIKDIGLVIEGEAALLVGTSSGLSNDPIGKILGGGILKYSSDLIGFREHMASVASAFGAVLNEYSHLDKLWGIFEPTLKFQAPIYESISILLESLGKLTAEPDRGVLELMRDKFERFSKAVEGYMNWQSHCRQKCRESRKEILEGRA